jgi:hypothetical protein
MFFQENDDGNTFPRLLYTKIDNKEHTKSFKNCKNIKNSQNPHVYKLCPYKFRILELFAIFEGSSVLFIHVIVNYHVK